MSFQGVDLVLDIHFKPFCFFLLFRQPRVLSPVASSRECIVHIATHLLTSPKSLMGVLHEWVSVLIGELRRVKKISKWSGELLVVFDRRSAAVLTPLHAPASQQAVWFAIAYNKSALTSFSPPVFFCLIDAKTVQRILKGISWFRLVVWTTENSIRRHSFRCCGPVGVLLLLLLVLRCAAGIALFRLLGSGGFVRRLRFQGEVHQ